MIDIKKFTIQSALEGLRTKQFTAADLVRACLANVKKYNDDYHALITVVDEAILIKQGEEMDKTDFSLPLSGIPIVLKDLFSTEGIRTTAGSKVLENYVPVYDATVVARLKAAGAIIIGKANQDAWAHGSSGENSDYVPTSNAYRKDRVAGGSSSGSAVAVALGMCLAATGTDTGGSIRVPASWNNLVGLKPSYGRVSRYGIIAMASSLDTIGHITKDVSDSAYLLSVTAGRDPYDASSADIGVPDYMSFLNTSTETTLKGVRIGVSKEYLAVGKKATKGMNPKLEEVTELALQKIVKLGASIVDISLPHTQSALETYYVIVPSEISSNLARFDGIRFGTDRAAFGDEAKRRMMIGTYALSSGYYDAYYKTASQVRTLVRKDFEVAFASVDVIFAPVSPAPPSAIGEYMNDPMSLYLSDIYTVPVNLAGLCAISVPAGFVDGLPIGIQLIGPQFGEEKIYHIASVYEKETQWYRKSPKI